LAGNSFSTGNGFGEWNKTLLWKKDEIIEMTVDIDSNSFIFKNLTTSEETNLTMTEGKSLADESW